MARGTTLANLLRMLKAEIGDELTPNVATALDAQYKILLSNKQAWLWEQFDWPWKHIRRDVTMVEGTRYYAFPSDIEVDRGVSAEAKWGSVWMPVRYGIPESLYNITDSDESDTSDPVQAWMISESGNVAAAAALQATEASEEMGDEGGSQMAVEGSVTGNTALEFEVWPIPATPQTLRFRGQKTLAALTYDSDTAEMDDLVLVLLVAAEILTRRKHTDAQAKLALANAHLQKLKASLPRSNSMFVLGGGAYGCQELRGTIGITRAVSDAIAGEGGGYIRGEG